MAFLTSRVSHTTSLWVTRKHLSTNFMVSQLYSLEDFAKSLFAVEHELTLDLKYDTARQFYIRAHASELESPPSLPEPFINIFPKNKYVECQTLTLVKLNQKIKDVHNEIVAMSDSSIQLLITEVRTRIHALFKISEGIALLDLLSAFAELVTKGSYVQPELSTDVLAVKSARHPIREKIQQEKYIPNDIYAPQAHKRFQIITGCNMSGKSTYIRSIALLTIMAQIGSFVPADYASFPIKNSLFARISTDNCVEANVSTFASEMREMSFILRNIEPRSLVIVDELGRGTSTTDGLSIAIAISEALIQSKAHVWFVTHFRDLPRILAERVGVYNLHMHVDIAPDFSAMKMRYRISEGREEQKYYGLALAQLVDLPDEVMEVAVAASQQLNARNEEKRGNAKVVTLAKRRKLAICLKMTLVQAVEGELAGEQLLEKMRKVQEEFCVRMAAIEAEYVVAVNGGGDSGSVDMSEDVVDDADQTPLEMEVVKSEQHDIDVHDTRQFGMANSEHDGHPAKPLPTTPNKYHHLALPIRPSSSFPSSDRSRDTPVQYDNPVFRPMPTGTPTRTESRSLPIKKEFKTEYTEMEDSVWTAFGQKGYGVDDPIYIEDDGLSVSMYSED